MLTNSQAILVSQQTSGKGDEWHARRAVGRLFDKAYRRGLLGRLWGKLTGKPSTLMQLNHRAKTSRRALGVGVVPLSRIVGTEGRSKDFDADFNPLKWHNRDRWISIASAHWLDKPLPAVELVQKGDEYYVRDGHHRISVAKSIGQQEIDARVVN